MAKRMSQGEFAGILFLVLIVGIASLIVKIQETKGLTIPIIVLVLILILGFYLKHLAIKKRREQLLDKYDDEKLVDKIMNGYFWQGMTNEQLTDSLGYPADIDQKVLKTKKKEIWKYSHEGGNRYRLRITLENDLVVGWKQR